MTATRKNISSTVLTEIKPNKAKKTPNKIHVDILKVIERILPSISMGSLKTSPLRFLHNEAYYLIGFPWDGSRKLRTERRGRQRQQKQVFSSAKFVTSPRLKWHFAGSPILIDT